MIRGIKKCLKYKLLSNFVQNQGISSFFSLDLSDDSERPGPLEIVVSKPEHKFELNLENLEKILCRDEIYDKPVVVVSVAGAFRKGKSFVLDFFLRYLNTKVL